VKEERGELGNYSTLLITILSNSVSKMEPHLNKQTEDPNIQVHRSISSLHNVYSHRKPPSMSVEKGYRDVPTMEDLIYFI
jgi:hypothetical protein